MDDSLESVRRIVGSASAKFSEVSSKKQGSGVEPSIRSHDLNLKQHGVRASRLALVVPLETRPKSLAVRDFSYRKVQALLCGVGSVVTRSLALTLDS